MMQRRTTIIAICVIVLVAGALYPCQAHAWSVPNYLKTYTVRAREVQELVVSSLSGKFSPALIRRVIQ